MKLIINLTGSGNEEEALPGQRVKNMSADAETGLGHEVERLFQAELEKCELENWLKRTLKELRKDGVLKNHGADVLVNGLIELNFVDSTTIHALNKEFRKVDRPTDVLSFSFLDLKRFPGDALIGQIFIEPKIAMKQAEEHGVRWSEEIPFLFVHALLHVFGFDHEEEADFRKMYAMQQRIMPGPKWEIFVKQIAEESFGRGASSRSL